MLDSEVLTAVTMKSAIFWNVTPCIRAEIHRRFGGIYYLHLQSRRVNEANNQREAGDKKRNLYGTTRRSINLKMETDNGQMRNIATGFPRPCKEGVPGTVCV
jgi:hypothetical protein